MARAGLLCGLRNMTAPGGTRSEHCHQTSLGATLWMKLHKLGEIHASQDTAVNIFFYLAALLQLVHGKGGELVIDVKLGMFISLS